jgi:hypothetical protein
MSPSRCLILCAVVLGCSGSALAQERRPLEIAGGYSYVKELIPDDSETNVTKYPKGFAVAAAWNVLNRVAVVGEFSRSAEGLPPGVDDVGIVRFGNFDSTVYNTLVGGRYWFQRLFVQALFGQVAVRTQAERLDGTLDETLTDLLVQPGVGFSIDLNSHVSARIHGDYRQVLSDENRFKRQFRIGVGAAVGFGGR